MYGLLTQKKLPEGKMITEFLVQELKSSNEFLDRATSELEETDSDYKPAKDSLTTAQQMQHNAPWNQKLYYRRLHRFHPSIRCNTMAEHWGHRAIAHP